ncbi:hypothetical protein [Paroceanicella profunda]|uniref:hypothetical protein n=1 Tax=Paroceanicella profunda TaxID=2579971 RepID=UPI001478D3D4|nr:hypothetical protein [Paroceanicella profunda]
MEGVCPSADGYAEIAPLLWRDGDATLLRFPFGETMRLHGIDLPDIGADDFVFT